MIMGKTNFCKTIDGLSRCTLENTKDQYTCLFFIKASQSAKNPSHCRYHRDEEYDNHCDNVNAQMDTEKASPVKEDIRSDFSY